MATFRIRTYRKLLQQLANRVIARSELTDLTDGSALKQILGAVAHGLEQASLDTARMLSLFNLDLVEGPDLDRRGLEYLPDGITRGPAARAVGTLRWTRPTPAPSAITIAAGTIVERASTNPRQRYVTTAPGQIALGATQSARTDGPDGDIPARAVTPGAAGNAAADTITHQPIAIPGAGTASNPTPFVGGEDSESDDAFRARIRAQTRALARCTPHALETRVLDANVDGRRIRASKLVDDPFTPAHAQLYVDDGAGTVETFATTGAIEIIVDSAIGGERRFHTRHKPLMGEAWTLTHTPSGGPAHVLTAGTDYIVTPSNGQIRLSADSFPDGLGAGDRLTIDSYDYWTGLVAEAQRLVDGDPRDPVAYPIWRGAAAFIRVVPPRSLGLVADIVAIVDEGHDRTTITTEVRAEILDYVNSLDIGAPVIVAEIIERAMAVDGMFDVEVIAPQGNVAVDFDEVIRLPSHNLTVQ